MQAPHNARAGYGTVDEMPASTLSARNCSTDPSHVDTGQRAVDDKDDQNKCKSVGTVSTRAISGSPSKPGYCNNIC